MTRDAFARLCVVGLLILGTAGASGQRAPARQAAVPTEVDLGTIFKQGLFLSDRNGDGLVDTIDAKVVLPAAASPAEIAAGANIAARLGFESTAFTPNLAARDSDVTPGAGAPPVILVGSGNRLVEQLVSAHKIDWGTLGAGQGVIAVVHQAFGSSDALVVAAADQAGMLAVGNAASARLPYLWRLRGDSIDRVRSDVEAVMAEKGVHPIGVLIPSAVYQAGNDRIARLRVEIDVPERDRRTVAGAFQHLADAHVVGKADFAGGAADRLSYYDVDVLEIAVVGAGTIAIPRFGPPYRNDYPASPSHPAPRELDLATLYTKNGLLADERGHDMIPDQTATEIIVGSQAGSAIETVDLAARIAMESTGVSLPLVKTDGEVKDPSAVPNPIVVGAGPLARVAHAGEPPAPGEGLVEIVPKAFGPFSAVVVSGGDDAGLNAGLSYLAGHVPYLWRVKRGDPDFAQVDDEAHEFFRGRSSAGQAARATLELSNVLDSLKATPLESVDVKAYLEEENPALAAYLQKAVKQQTGAATVTAAAPSRYGPVQILKETPDLGWEVDELRQRFKSDVLSRIKSGDRVQLEVEVSEPAEVRTGLERELASALQSAGASEAHVRVICAYKQGYSWLADYVLPQLKQKPVASIAVRFPTATTRFDAHEYGLPIRWLQEIFPIDEIFARELHIPLDATSFEKIDGGPIRYQVQARDKAGKILFSDDFAPRYEQRDYVAGRPVARIQYTTGGIRAIVNGATIADLHVRTDPERFWDYYQKTLLPRVFEYVRSYTSGDLSARNQPFFRDLIFDITMSEPDYRLDLDEERISSLDSLHEDLMFDTIDFFGMFSGRQPGSRNVAPGRILPLIHESEPGKPPRVTVTLNGNAVPRPRLDVAWTTRTGATGSKSIEIGDAGLEPPRVISVRVRANSDQIADLTVGVAGKSYGDADRAARLVDTLATLQSAGVLTRSLNYDHLQRLSVASLYGDRRIVRELTPRGTERQGRLGAFTAIQTDPGRRIVTWDHPIFPDELERDLIPRLSAYPEVNPYVVGHTYRGRHVWAMDVMLPITSTLWSQAKASTTKPVLFVTTRQHSNELSATSATLRLVELLARDPEYRKYLTRMNIVYNPMENPDGAANDELFSKLHPTFINHGGYWSAVARDVGAYIWDPDPLLPEALVRRKIYDSWLPDDYMNTHGYPSHEWVHQFAGYKVPWFLLFWIPRGYHINLHHMKNDNYPDADAVGLELRDRIIDEVQGNPEIRSTNARLIHRYEKYARRYLPDPFRLELYKGMNILFDYSYSFEDGPPFTPNIYVDSLWKQPNPNAQSFIERYPQLTVLDLGCDMPDEGASPRWLEHMAAPGQFGYLMANIKLLFDSHYEIKRYEEDFKDSVHLSIFRPRPVKASRTPSAVSPTHTGP